MAALPVVTIPDQAAMFAPGGSGEVSVQWTPGQIVGLFAGLELPSPVPIVPYGLLYIDPTTAAVFGTAVAPASGLAPFPYALPPDPALSGRHIGLQAIATTGLPAGLLLSTFQAFWVW